MREILFRGKRIDNSMWLYGSLRQYKDGTCGICDRELEHTYRVDPNTVGQYTGLTDKYSRKIFEGDIVETYNYSTLMEIRWNEKTAAFELWRYDTWYGQVHTFNPIKVLGNVFDNPELME